MVCAHLLDALQPGSTTVTASGPIRYSDLDVSSWNAPDFNTSRRVWARFSSDLAQYLVVYNDTINHPNIVPDMRVPNISAFRCVVAPYSCGSFI